MLRSIFTTLIIGLFALGAMMFVAPKQTTLVINNVLGVITEFKKTVPAVPLPDQLLEPQQGTKNPSSGDTTTIPEDIGDDSGPFSIENIIDATNKERIKAGLTPLKVNVLLNKSAKVKTEDMIEGGYFEHVSPVTGKSVSDLGRDQGYDYILMGENLALGNFINANDLLQAWMKSPGHRANILNTGYQEIGVYAERGTYQGHEVWFAVQHFGTARGVCPKIDESLKVQIDTMNATLKAEDSQITTMRAQIESENHPTGEQYQTMVNQFNTLVATYNSELAISQKKISTYNAQVKAFNACLSLYQK